MRTVLTVIIEGDQLSDEHARRDVRQALAHALSGVAAFDVQIACDHQYEEQPGEPPIDVCTRCGDVKE